MNQSGSWYREEHVRQSKYIETEVTEKLDGLEIPHLRANEQLQLACGSFTNTIYHSRATTLLVENGYDGSALALARSCFEAFVAGLWLRSCANKDDVLRVGKTGKKPFPHISKMIAAIKAKRSADGLKQIKELTWDIWNSHTHGGWEQIQGQLSPKGLKQNYSAESVSTALMSADYCHLLSAAEIAAAAGTTSLQYHFINRSNAYQQHLAEAEVWS